MFTLISKCTKIACTIGVQGCGPKRQLSTMKSSSIETNDDVDVDIVVVEEERGAKQAGTPIYNALKPSVRMIRVRHACRSKHLLRMPFDGQSTTLESMNTRHGNANKI